MTSSGACGGASARSSARAERALWHVRTSSGLFEHGGTAQAPERTGQLNSRHSHESQPEQSSLVCRIPKPAVVVMMAAAAIVFLVIVAVVVIIVSTLTICFFGARPIETIFGAFGFLAVD